DDVFLSQKTLTPVDLTYRVIDFEAAARIMETNAWFYGGGYQVDGTDVSTLGYKAGVRGYVLNDLVLDFGASDDDVWGTKFRFGIVFFPGRTPNGLNHGPRHTVYDRLREPVWRNNYIAMRQSVREGALPLTDPNGDLIRVVHVDGNSLDGGDGSFQSPLSSLDDVFANSSPGDIVLVHADTTYTGQSVALQDNQRLLGEGGSQTHTVSTERFGAVTLPESSTGALAGAVPVIMNAPADAIVLNPVSSDPDNPSSMEISNLAIDGGARGIASPTGIGEVDINRVAISNTSGNGIELSPLVETLADSSKQVRFNPTIDQVTFDGIGGDDISINSDTSEPDTTPVIESIAISNVTSTNAQGLGINLRNNRNTAAITDFDYDGGTTGLGGIFLSGNQATVNVTRATIANGNGPGIDITETDTTVNITDSTVTDTGLAGVQISGGSSDVNFSGKITQAANASAVAVLDGHTGVATFTEADAGTGVITATNGDGIQLSNADGTYFFNDAVVLNGGDAGIDVLDDTDGVVSFDDVTITNPSGTALNIDGGAANLSLTGRIAQGNNALTVSVSGGHTGTLSMTESTTDEGIIAATNGAGMRFDNADGTYTFSDAVLLNGGTAGIDILNGSAGTITFNDAQITSPNAVAFNVDGGSADVNFTGNITQNNSFSTIAVSGGHTGTLDFSESTANAGVVLATNGDGLQFNNADGAYVFNDAVVLNGGDAGIDISNDSDGTFSFPSTAVITNPSGTGLHITGSAALVTYAGQISNNTGRAVVIDGNNGGNVTVSGEVTDTAQGLLVQNNTGGTFRFTGLVDLETAANNAATIDNNSNSTTSFSNLQVATTSGTGFLVTNSDAVEVSGSTSNIESTTGTAVDISGSRISNVGVSFESVSADGAANGIRLQNVTGGQFATGLFGSNAGDGGTIQNTTGAGVLIDNAASVSLNHLMVENTLGRGIDVAHSSGTASTVTVANSTVRGAGAEGLNLNSTGSGTMRMTLTSNSVDTSVDQGINIDVAGSTSIANITLNGNTVVNDTGDEAVLLTASGNTAKTLNLLVNNNQFTNGDPAAVAASFQMNGAVSFNATVTNNTFVNSDNATGRPFEMAANNGASNIRLSLRFNTAQNNNANDEYFLEQNTGSFTLEKLTVPAVPPDQVPEQTVFEENTGTINITGTITTDPGNIPTP
ncbi:MAG: right-handed parallel beta-helix repeat-containing protein, partial [Planctomycetales bacterium]|nr:right-handed parallel beta-helix repeat-containing protein [Planctomycetales bacterium]